MKTYEKQSKSKKKNSLEDVKQAFEQEKAEVVTKPQVRTVKLYASSCCGCGCSDIQILREVPIDSHWEDYEHVGSDILETDTIGWR